MITDINSEDRLVQQTFADHLRDRLGWDSLLDHGWPAGMRPISRVAVGFARKVQKKIGHRRRVFIYCRQTLRVGPGWNQGG